MANKTVQARIDAQMLEAVKAKLEKDSRFKDMADLIRDKLRAYLNEKKPAN